MIKSSPVAQQTTTPAVRSKQILNTLVSPSGIFASGDRLFRNAIFGRDSLEVAEDILLSSPKIAKTIILSIAALQGTTVHYLSEEEPGRIHHEHRSISIGDTRTNKISLAILRAQIVKWGGTEESMTYYGAVDATPLFVRVVDTYCQQYGTDLLQETIVNKKGQRTTVLECVQAAIGWVVARLEQSPLGLLEFKRTQPHGHQVQAWKDSEEFYVHPNGTPITSAVASIEVQGLVYDCLAIAAKLFPEQQNYYVDLAANIQKRVLNDMWLPDEQFFALGYDYDAANQPSLIHLTTANPGELLDTTIFDNLPDQRQELYMQAILKKLFSHEFLTSAGIRSRSLVHDKLISFWDYHGSFVTWPKETYDIAKGLRRQGFDKLATILDERLEMICRITGQYPEFVYVEQDGTLLISHFEESSDATKRALVTSTNIPERVQAWTISAIIGIHQRHPAHAPKQSAWKPALEQSLMASISGRNNPAKPELTVLGSYSMTKQ